MSDSESSDGSIIQMEPKECRKKKGPERFGDTGILDLSEEGDLNNTFERMISDDSMDEYIAEKPDKNVKKRRVVHTVCRVTKKKKADGCDVQRKISWGDNFDKEFENLNSQKDHELIDCETEPISSNKNHNNYPSDKNTDQISATEEPGECVIENSIDIDTNSKKIDDCIDSKTLSGLSSNVNGNHKLLLEILTRIRVIEESLMKNGTLAGASNNMGKESSFEELQIFSKSNHLPLQNIEDMNSFEENLCDPDFRKIAVRT